VCTRKLQHHWCAFYIRHQASKCLAILQNELEYIDVFLLSHSHLRVQQHHNSSQVLWPFRRANNCFSCTAGGKHSQNTPTLRSVERRVRARRQFDYFRLASGNIRGACSTMHTVWELSFAATWISKKKSLFLRKMCANIFTISWVCVCVSKAACMCSAKIGERGTDK